jgi:hypothetical protein
VILQANYGEVTPRIAANHCSYFLARGAEDSLAFPIRPGAPYNRARAVCESVNPPSGALSSRRRVKSALKAP